MTIQRANGGYFNVTLAESIANDREDFTTNTTSVVSGVEYLADLPDATTSGTYSAPSSSLASPVSTTVTITTTATTTSTPSPETVIAQPAPQVVGHNDKGAIGGGVVGGVCATVLIGIAVYFLRRRRQHKLDTAYYHHDTTAGISPYPASSTLRPTVYSGSVHSKTPDLKQYVCRCHF